MSQPTCHPLRLDGSKLHVTTPWTPTRVRRGQWPRAPEIQRTPSPSKRGSGLRQVSPGARFGLGVRGLRSCDPVTVDAVGLPVGEDFAVPDPMRDASVVAVSDANPEDASKVCNQSAKRTDMPRTPFGSRGLDTNGC